jgi:hypothetical protein
VGATRRPGARRGDPRRRGDRPADPRRRQADRPDRRRRDVRRRALVRRGPRRGRRACPDDLKPGLVRRRPGPPPGVLADRLAAGRRRPPGDRAGAGGGCARQPRPGIGRAAPREAPPGGAAPRRRCGAGPPVLDRRRGRGVPRRL